MSNTLLSHHQTACEICYVCDFIVWQQKIFICSEFVANETDKINNLHHLGFIDIIENVFVMNVTDRIICVKL